MTRLHLMRVRAAKTLAMRSYDSSIVGGRNQSMDEFIVSYKLSLADD